jgi:glutathione S-transferase
MVAAHELGLVDRLNLRRTVVQMTSPNLDLMPDNPLSKIPTLVLEDGEVLVDSGVICEYFDALAGGNRIIPGSGPARWAELSRHAMTTGLLDILILWRNERNKPAQAQTASWLTSFEAKAIATLARFEKSAMTANDGPLSLSAITLGCVLSYLDFRFEDWNWRSNYPLLSVWHASFCKRPSAIATEVVNDS